MTQPRLALKKPRQLLECPKCAGGLHDHMKGYVKVKCPKCAGWMVEVES